MSGSLLTKKPTLPTATSKGTKPLLELTDAEAVAASQENTLAWTATLAPSPAAVRTLLAQTPAELERFVQESLGLADALRDAKQRLLLDAHVSAVWFAREAALAPQQASAFLAVVAILLGHVKDQRKSRAVAVAHCKELLMAHAPAALDRDVDESGRYYDFPPAALHKILAYFQETIFQHYALYELVLSDHAPVAAPLVVRAPLVPPRAVNRLAEGLAHPPPSPPPPPPPPPVAAIPPPLDSSGDPTAAVLGTESPEPPVTTLGLEQADALRAWLLERFVANNASTLNVDPAILRAQLGKV